MISRHGLINIFINMTSLPVSICITYFQGSKVYLAYSNSLDLKCIRGMSQASENSSVSDWAGFNEHCRHTADATSLPLIVFGLGTETDI